LPKASFWGETFETFEKCSILAKVKEGENFNPRNRQVIFRELKIEPDAEIRQKEAFFKGSPLFKGKRNKSGAKLRFGAIPSKNKPDTPDYQFKNDGLPGSPSPDCFREPLNPRLLMLNGGSQIGQQGDLTGSFDSGR
jgi:hypothetical protein